IFIADEEYMFVAFNIGGQGLTGVVNTSIDNIKIVEYLESPADLNNDYELNLLDLAIFASEWMNCNRDNPADCWQ
ncbi:MAG: hypothetical protein PHQ00_05680, partial [Phycisphaerae bacterium]|nr:hypothetical protein [Phycisphaerae bacterium]